MTKRTDPFDWSGGHPALDFANTLDERPLPSPIEHLATYASLVQFTELAELIEPAAARRLRSLGGPAGARVARRARELREQMFTTLTAIDARRAVPPASLEAIASEIRTAHVAQTFASTGATITRRWIAPAAPEIPLHVCALAIEDLLLLADRARIRKCAAHDCAVYFIDTSKAHRRQWCSMQNCGNREKQRRWRAE